MAEQELHGRWFVDLTSGETEKPFLLKPGHRAWVTHAVLVDPAIAASGQTVRVAICDKTGNDQIRLVLSADRPVASVPSTVMMDQVFWLEREYDASNNAVVRFVGGHVVDVLGTSETAEMVEDDGEDHEALLEQEDEDDDAEAADHEEMVEDDGAEGAGSQDRGEMVEENGCWFVDLRSGETKQFPVKPGQHVWVCDAKIVRPSSAPAGKTMRVAIRTKTGDVHRLELWAERNVVAPRTADTEMLYEEFWLEREEDDCADTVVRFTVCNADVHTIPSLLAAQAEMEGWSTRWRTEEHHGEAAVSSEDVDDEEMEESEEDGDDFSDDEEESDGEFQVGGYMCVHDADEENQEGGGDRQILVLYRYTYFSAAWSYGSVEARGSTREHQLRFTAAADHGARSLAWAGASLADLIYPDGCSKNLRELWKTMASGVSLPPGAARVKVLVEVGILPQEDYTAANMDHMMEALKVMIQQPQPGRFTGMELNLPNPVRCGHDEDKTAQDEDTDDEQKPAKRRRVVAAEEDCSVCLEPLLNGDDLAAWPGCGKPHVFHGKCMEGILEINPVCPFCRRGLYNEPKF
jgi:hypothetical protein